MSLHLSLPDRCIHIHNIYNPVNSKKVNTSIPILKRKLAAYPNKEHIILGDFNLHHEVWGGTRASKALIEKSEELLMVTRRWEMEQMVPVGTAIYKESIGKSTTDLIFATPLLSKSIISCNIVNWVASFLTNRQTIVKTNEHTTPKLYTDLGLPQGSPLSSILYLFYNVDLLDNCTKKESVPRDILMTLLLYPQANR